LVDISIYVGGFIQYQSEIENVNFSNNYSVLHHWTVVGKWLDIGWK
jgi:hypothetical protein